MDKRRVFKVVPKGNNSPEKYKEVIDSIKELKSRSNKHNAELVRELVSSFKDKLNKTKYEIYYQGKLIKTTIKLPDWKTLLKYKGEYIESIRAKRKDLKEIRKEKVNINGFVYEKLVGHKYYGLPTSPLGLLHKRHTPSEAMNNKSPVAKSNYIGVELEFASSISRDQFAILVCENKLSGKVRVGPDGSIRTDEKCKHQIEIAILDREESIKGTIMKLEKIFKNINYDFMVNNSCGCHIHLDMRQRDVSGCYTKLFNNIDTIINSTTPERQDNQYCTKNIASKIEDAKVKFKSSNGARYQTINPTSYEKYKTLEIRAFEGTLEMSKVCNWIDMLLNIINEKRKRL